MIACHPASARDSLLNITVHIYDYSRVQPTAMPEALRSAEATLRQAGIEVQWQTCPVGRAASSPGCDVSPADATNIVLSILPEPMSAKIAGGSKQFGLSMMNGEDGLPCHAYIFRDRILNFANDRAVPWTQLFGNVIAHELGHLLLGTNSHAPHGIMRATWQGTEVKGALGGTLAFTRQQAKMMQANVRRRLETAKQESNPPKVSESPAGSAGAATDLLPPPRG